MATHPQTIQGYNENAETYNQHVNDPDDSLFHGYYEKPAIRAELPKLEGLSVISIGCGSGVDAQWLLDNGAAKVVGVDISEGLISIAKREHADIEFQVMDMEQLNFADESFDVAYSSLAIHYLDNWLKALKEAKRLLKPGGKYVFSCGHPMDSAMEYFTDGTVKGARLGRTVQLDTNERTIYGDYLAAAGEGVRELKWKQPSGTPLIVYHRPLNKILADILASGFIIEKMVEPLPIAELKDKNPDLYEQLSKIPSFIIWVLRK